MNVSVANDGILSMVADSIVAAKAGISNIKIAADDNSAISVNWIVKVVAPAPTAVVTPMVDIKFQNNIIRNPQGLNLRVYNALGALVAEGNSNIDMSQQNSGLYIVKNGKEAVKIIK